MNDAKRVLVLGCGRNPVAGAVNLDVVLLPGVNVVFDLDTLYYHNLPFPNCQFDEIQAYDVLEHVDNLVGVVNELWRILLPAGTLLIRGPSYKHPEIVWADPTHRRAFAPRTFDGWDRAKYDGKHYGHYMHRGVYFFRVVKIEEVNCNYEYTLVKEDK